MKNDNYSVSPNKKSYAFKPKNSKIKRNEFDTVLNNILKKSKEEEQNSKSKENIKSINVTMHPQQEKYQQKKILYERKKNRKKNSNPNIKNLFSNQKIKNQQNENNNNNKQQPKKFFLNINEEKPQLTSSKKIRVNKRGKEINNKKNNILNLNSSKSKKDMNTTDSDSAEKSSRSTKQIKPVHMKKDFYIPTVCASLISPKQKKSNSNLNSNLESSFSSNSSSKSTGKGSFRFNERRKEHIIERYHTMTNSINYNNNNINKLKLSDSVNQGSFNYEKVLNDLNFISGELSLENKDDNYSRNFNFSGEKKRKRFQRSCNKNPSLNEFKQNNSVKIINL